MLFVVMKSHEARVGMAGVAPAARIAVMPIALAPCGEHGSSRL